MSMKSLEWTKTCEPPRCLSGGARLGLAVVAAAVAVVLLSGWQTGTAVAVADWLGLGTVDASASQFIAALAGG